MGTTLGLVHVTSAYAQSSWETTVKDSAAESRNSTWAPVTAKSARRTNDDKPPIWTTAAAPAAIIDKAPKRSEPVPADTSLAGQYCVSIANAAADARMALQKKALSELEEEVEKRVRLLEAKAVEVEKWVARRDEFSKKAQESLVQIYTRMRPDAAAAQLVAMDLETAAAVLTKLDPKNAGAILNEMQPTQAARLTATIAGAAKVAPAASVDQQKGKKS
jgi:flagellar motility protein MotE (MotC chaperone)